MAAFAKNIASALLLASLRNTHFAVIPPLSAIKITSFKYLNLFLKKSYF